MLDILISVIAFIVTLGILVTFHEFGHFWVARRCGVKVLRFSVGFGKAMKTWVGKDGVEYVLAPIPLGGYVKMLGQDDVFIGEKTQSGGSADQTGDGDGVQESERQQSFACKPLWQRMAIVAAGPAANFLLAFVVYWLININYGVHGVAPVVSGIVEDSPADLAGLQAGDQILAVDGEETIIWRQVRMQMLSRIGETGELVLTIDPAQSDTPQDVRIPIQDWLRDQTEPQLLSDLGILDREIPAVIGAVVAGGAAEAGGLRAADEIVSVDGQPIRDWRQWVEVVRASPELPLAVTVQRNGSFADLEIRPQTVVLDDGTGIGSVGVYLQETRLTELVPAEQRRSLGYGPIAAVGLALEQTWDKSLLVLDSVRKLVVGLLPTSQVSGPITIAEVAGETVRYGPEVYLNFLALLSISLGVLNLLPIPILDGGHLLYFTIEAIIRRPVPEAAQTLGLFIGLLFVGGIMALSISNDVTRLFW